MQCQRCKYFGWLGIALKRGVCNWCRYYADEDHELRKFKGMKTWPEDER